MSHLWKKPFDLTSFRPVHEVYDPGLQQAPGESVSGLGAETIIRSQEVHGHLRQDKLYIKENEGILHEVKISPAAYRRDVPCSCP